MVSFFQGKLLPLENEYDFHEFVSPQLNEPDFDAKPMILLGTKHGSLKTFFSGPMKVHRSLKTFSYGPLKVHLPLEVHISLKTLFSGPFKVHGLLKTKDSLLKTMSMLPVGQYSTGKTSFIRYLLERDYPGIRIGPEPTTGTQSILVIHGNV